MVELYVQYKSMFGLYPLKIQLFLWLAVHDRILTKENLAGLVKWIVNFVQLLNQFLIYLFIVVLLNPFGINYVIYIHKQGLVQTSLWDFWQSCLSKVSKLPEQVEPVWGKHWRAQRLDAVHFARSLMRLHHLPYSTCASATGFTQLYQLSHERGSLSLCCRIDDWLACAVQAEHRWEPQHCHRLWHPQHTHCHGIQGREEDGRGHRRCAKVYLGAVLWQICGLDPAYT